MPLTSWQSWRWIPGNCLRSNRRPIDGEKQRK
jgi:hypothetical protein